MTKMVCSTPKCSGTAEAPPGLELVVPPPGAVAVAPVVGVPRSDSGPGSVPVFNCVCTCAVFVPPRTLAAVEAVSDTVAGPFGWLLTYPSSVTVTRR